MSERGGEALPRTRSWVTWRDATRHDTTRHRVIRHRQIGHPRGIFGVARRFPATERESRQFIQVMSTIFFYLVQHLQKIGAESVIVIYSTHRAHVAFRKQRFRSADLFKSENLF